MLKAYCKDVSPFETSFLFFRGVLQRGLVSNGVGVGGVFAVSFSVDVDFVLKWSQDSEI